MYETFFSECIESFNEGIKGPIFWWNAAELYSYLQLD